MLELSNCEAKKEFLTFLANNYFWFLIIALILIFALIGYFVDASEQKKGVSSIVKEKPVEKDIRDLAKNAGNKTLNNAINNANITNMMPNLAEANNTITDTTLTNQSQMPNTEGNTNPIGFDVLNK